MNGNFPTTVANLYIEEIDKIIDEKAKILLKGEEISPAKKLENGVKMLLEFKLGIQRSMKDK